jgi:uncharacterized protein (UPF0147 family)
LAVIEPAWNEAKRLWGEGEHATANHEISQLQAEHKQNVAAGQRLGDMLKAGSPERASRRLDSTTVAFAAAYLSHYAEFLGYRQRIQDKHIPKLLYKIAQAHAKKERGDARKLTLLRYDTAGSLLEEIADDDIINAPENKRWRLTVPGHGTVRITWAELPTMVAMSNIVTARMGLACETYAELVDHGMHYSPFEVEGTALGHFCAAGPLFNKHYTDAMMELFGEGPHIRRPRAGRCPQIPLAFYADPSLNVVVNNAVEMIRDICDAEYGPVDRKLSGPLRNVFSKLEDSTRNDASNYVDRTTMAFSAAYLQHYANHLQIKDSINDKHLPKLLLKIAKEHTKRERGDKLTLKAYDTNGHFLRDTVRSYITHTNKKRHWKVGNLNMT